MADSPFLHSDCACRHAPENAAIMAELVSSLLGPRLGKLTLAEAALFTEIEDLAATVARARAEITAIRADDINASCIPTATDELDAIVSHTAAATDSILESCENLEAMMGRLKQEDAQAVQACVTRIYEACSFQDITGQRITKVVAALQVIEKKVAHLVGVFSSDVAPVSVLPKMVEAEASLLHGPQLPKSAMGQSAIDDLLASFD